MDPPINHSVLRNARLSEIKTLIGNLFTKLKANNVELVVVIIPDYPPGIYGE